MENKEIEKVRRHGVRVINQKLHDLSKPIGNQNLIAPLPITGSQTFHIKRDKTDLMKYDLLVYTYHDNDSQFSLDVLDNIEDNPVRVSIGGGNIELDNGIDTPTQLVNYIKITLSVDKLTTEGGFITVNPPLPSGPDKFHVSDILFTKYNAAAPGNGDLPTVTFGVVYLETYSIE